jgi:hypothetical protein
VFWLVIMGLNQVAGFCQISGQLAESTPSG